MRRPLIVVCVVVGATLLFLADGWYGPRGWCGATADIRILLGDADLTARSALASGEVARLRVRAERMVWPRGDLATRIVDALAEVAEPQPERASTEAMLRFVRLDNEFREEHCDFRPS